MKIQNMTWISVWAVVIAVAMFQTPAQAGCSGSGTSVSCPSGSTEADVQAAINNSQNGAVITLASGTYNWSQWVQFSTGHGNTLTCAVPGTCVINASGTVFGINGFSGILNYFYRISGFTFQGNKSPVIRFDTLPNASGTLSTIRMDHNLWTNLQTGNYAILFGDNLAKGGYYYGVIDHNMLNNPTPAALVGWMGAASGMPQPSARGMGSNMFIEDNVITIAASPTAVPASCGDFGPGAVVVVRHNISTNCVWTPNNPQNYEFYASSAIEFGLLANRPSDCAPGVGYLATDVGRGTLYLCSAPNTWTTWYTPYVYPHPLVSGMLLGDVNGDGKVDLADAVAVAEYVIGVTMPNFNPEAAKVDGNTVLTLNDAMLIAKFVIRLISGFPA